MGRWLIHFGNAVFLYIFYRLKCLMSLTTKRTYRFEEFELRVNARLLERNGNRVPLGSKAFEVLTCLVTNAGEVVTKDYLLKTVWPESFVEEGNLSQHIFALRKAFGDRSSYIVTVPGRGYQFTAAVHEVAAEPMPIYPEDAGSFVVQRTRERTHVIIDETSMSSEGLEASSPEVSLLSAVKRPIVLRLLIALLAILAVAGTFFFLWRSQRKQRGNLTVVLAELENKTGDAGFDVVLRKALEIDLDQSPFLEVMSESEALSTLRRMGQQPGTAINAAMAREVCERSNRQVLVTGSVATIGKRYLLTLEAADCSSGKRLADTKADAGSKEDMLRALDLAADKLRSGLGESAQSIERFKVPIAEATTSSLEALKQYSTGEYFLGRMGKEEGEVLPFFERAVELDPQFAMANVALATGYYNLGEYQKASPYYKRAFDESGQVSEKERLYIRAHYYADDLKDIEQGIREYRMWSEIYPRDWGPWIDMAKEYTALGEYTAAIAAGEHALALDTSRGIIYGVLARAYLRVNRYAEAEVTVGRAYSIGKDTFLLHETLLETAIAEQNEALLAKEATWSEGKLDSWEVLKLQALAAAGEGKYARALECFRAAHEVAERDHLPERADQILISEASTEVAFGMSKVAQNTLSQLEDQHSEDPEVALLRAELGKLPTPGAGRAPPLAQDTLLDRIDALRLRAELALNKGNPADAIAALQPMEPYDFAVGFDVTALRGAALLLAKQPEQAALQYRKILDHRGVDPMSPLYALAYLGLARAERQMGHITESRAEYERLFALWKDADADLPVLLTARREYAAVGQERASSTAAER